MDCRHDYYIVSGPGAEDVDYICRQCGFAASGLRYVWTERLRWLLWLFEHKRMGGRDDGLEREPLEARKRTR